MNKEDIILRLKDSLEVTGDPIKDFCDTQDLAVLAVELYDKQKPQLKWTREAPTKVGWYWMSIDDIPGSLGVVNVYEGLRAQFRWVDTEDHHNGVSVKKYAARWCGPLETPSDE